MNDDVGMAVRSKRAWICGFRHLGSGQGSVWRYIQTRDMSMLPARQIAVLQQMMFGLADWTNVHIPSMFATVPHPNRSRFSSTTKLHSNYGCQRPLVPSSLAAKTVV